MLGITATNQAASSNNLGFGGYGSSDSYGSSASASGIGFGFGSSAGMMLDDDIMDPLFDDDWLHEHNLDILFDLFEEEMGTKCGVESNTGSSTLFGTSPVTSHLFGTSPSLAFDLLCFDNQQQQPNISMPHQNCNITNNNSIDVTSNQQQANAMINKLESLNNNSAGSNISAELNSSITSTIGGLQQLNQPCSKNVNSNSKSTSAISITQAMRIKRGLKKGQSEGVSLLARPLASNNNGQVSINNNCADCSNAKFNSNNSNNIARTLKFSTINGCGPSGASSSGKIIVNKSNSDKTSAKITNFKNLILGKNDNYKVTNGVEINYSKQSQNYRYLKHNCHQHHVHYVTGRAVIREHAYAVRGH